MAVVSGNGGVLQISEDDSSYHAVATLTDWSIETSAEVIDATGMTTNNFKDFLPGMYSWSGSASAHWNDDDDAQEEIERGLLAGDSTFWVKLYPVGTSGGDWWSGKIVVSSLSRSGALNSPISFSFSFQGTGALTRTNA
tara:strand:- start:487 stop:903 length:417 start_codon:yes stop_codon:yes gene_type:complete